MINLQIQPATWSTHFIEILPINEVGAHKYIGLYLSIDCSCHQQMCIRETPKREVLQSENTQTKCSILLHFMRVYTKGKKDFQPKNTIFVLNYNLTPQDMYIGLSTVYCIKPEGRIY